MANPRKFSEKIALQKQKQAEGTAEFEKIMNEVKATRVVDGVLGSTDLTDVGNLQRNASLSGGSGGSGTSSGASGGGASPDANASGGGGIAGGGGGIGVNSSTGSPAAYRESRGRSVGVGPMRRPSERKQDRSPYGSTASGLMLSGIIPNNSYLSPPMDTSWRRSNSDSALHQTLNMAEGNFGASSPVPGMMGDLNSLHANYHHHQHNQRSHSPNIGRSYSPQAQRRKNNLLHQQQQQQQHQMQQQQSHHQQQQQLQHQRLQMQQAQHQQQQQHHQQQHLQQHLQNQQQTLQQQQQLHQQQQQYNAKFNNSNIMFKSLQEQQLGFNNTGSLPDLTSVHYATQTNNTQMMQPTSQQQQQQTLSPILSPHHNNGCHDRDQSPSPFSPPSTTGGGSGGGGPPSPYHQQQNSPTSAANTPTAANAQTSPHLSFTNLAVQSPVNVQQTTAQNTAAAFSTLPTLGATSSTGNLTDYRQPLNPPSPGSSPGLLTSGPANDIHISAPPSPIRHCQNNINSSTAGNGGSAQVGQGQQQQQMATQQSLQNAFGTIDSNAGYNTLNPAFHNHFEQFNLGDSSQSPQNTYDALEFEEFNIVTSTSNQLQQQQQHNTFNSKITDFGDLTSTSSSSSSNNTRTNNTNTTTNCNNNNNNLPGVQQQQQQQQQHHQRNNSQQFQQQQQHINNNTTTNTSSSNAHTNGPVTSRTHNAGLMNNNDRQDILSSNSSPIPSPLSHCVPSPSSPLPIPMSGHSPSHQQQQQQLSLSVQTSPHHSPMHSPHHSPSPLSVSSPGLTMLGGSISPVPSPSAHIMQQQHQQHNHVNNQTATQMHHNQTSQAANQHQQQHHHHHSQQQTHTPCNTTTNIPQIIFSDYSSSRDIFDHLDLDLGPIDEPGLQMLSDQNPIMIADPSIEDSFRRDLN